MVGDYESSSCLFRITPAPCYYNKGTDSVLKAWRISERLLNMLNNYTRIRYALADQSAVHSKLHFTSLIFICTKGYHANSIDSRLYSAEFAKKMKHLDTYAESSDTEDTYSTHTALYAFVTPTKVITCRIQSHMRIRRYSLACTLSITRNPLWKKAKARAKIMLITTTTCQRTHCTVILPIA